MVYIRTGMDLELKNVMGLLLNIVLLTKTVMGGMLLTTIIMTTMMLHLDITKHLVLHLHANSTNYGFAIARISRFNSVNAPQYYL